MVISMSAVTGVVEVKLGSKHIVGVFVPNLLGDAAQQKRAFVQHDQAFLCWQCL
jgi:hypothetical protein